MELDWQTIRDLELFQGSSLGPSIFEILDRTKTSDGKRSLLKRFERPFSDLSRIHETQSMVNFLATFGNDFAFPFSQTDLDQFVNYLQSSFLIYEPKDGILGLLETKWMSLQNEAFIRFTREEPWIVLGFLQKAKTMFDRLDTCACPEPLRKEIHFFRTLETAGNLGHWWQKRASSDVAGNLTVDRLLRKDLKESLLQLLVRLISLDGLFSMAQVNRDLGLAIPEFSESPDQLVQIEGLYHLFVREPVANDFKAKKGHHILFLTGPNMGGKTTYLKAATVAVLLAHVGMGVPAKAMRLTVFSRIFCSLNAVDNIREKVSSFYSEVRRVKQVVEAMREEGRVFAVFDELFKGTNVKDALDCSDAVVKGFTRFPRHVLLVSSHLLELHNLLATFSEISFSHFACEMIEGKAVFDYRLKPGVNSQRLGYFILQEEGVLHLLS